MLRAGGRPRPSSTGHRAALSQPLREPSGRRRLSTDGRGRTPVAHRREAGVSSAHPTSGKRSRAGSVGVGDRWFGALALYFKPGCHLLAL